jgi:hypothetical protein
MGGRPFARSCRCPFSGTRRGHLALIKLALGGRRPKEATVGGHSPAEMNWTRWFRAARQTPSAVLLVVQLAALLVYPLLEDNAAGRAVFSLLGIAVLALVVLAVRSSPPATWVSLLLAGPAVVLLLIQTISGARLLQPWSAGFEAALYFYAAVGLIRYMVADRQVTIDELFAVGATFTLLAWAFAYTYVVLQAVSPGSFTVAVDPHAPRSWLELLFLSFTTLTSTGLSDVIPIRLYARSVVMLEQVTGMLYIAMIITRLVGLSFTRISRAPVGRAGSELGEDPGDPDTVA